jgi:hypothetical protein
VHEDTGTLTVQQNRAHLERITGMLEWLHGSVQEHSAPWCFLILDTLHITQCARPGTVQWNDVHSFDQRLASLDCKLLFLKTSSASIWERGIVPRKNEPFLIQYARKFGNTPEEIHQYFVSEQELLGELFARSTMPKLPLDGDRPSEEVLEEAYEFWTDSPRKARAVS